MADMTITAQTAVPRGLRPKLKRAVIALLDELGHPEKELDMWLVDDIRIQALKLEHWGEDQATDVLSFPTYEPGDPFVPPHLGDVVISMDTAARQAVEQGHDLLVEVKILAAHSVWHLLGHDHQTEADWEGFKVVQERILAL